MADEYTTTTTTPNHPAANTTTIVERRGGGGGWAFAIVLLVAVLIGAYFLFGQQRTETRKDNAVAGAAKSVGRAADKVGEAVSGEAK